MYANTNWETPAVLRGLNPLLLYKNKYNKEFKKCSLIKNKIKRIKRRQLLWQ
jgi:hypothetical protein